MQMVSIPFRWNAFTRNELDWYLLPSSSLHTNGWQLTAQRGGRLSGENEKRDRGAVHYNAGNVRSPGGETNARLRCLRRGTGAAHSRSPHRLRQEPVPHRRPRLLPPPHHQGRRRTVGVHTSGVTFRRGSKCTLSRSTGLGRSCWHQASTPWRTGPSRHRIACWDEPSPITPSSGR